jgi:lipoprotein-anchoring transpeptidase ErfK/SrfK
MFELVYTPSATFTVDGVDYVLLARTIPGISGTAYSIHRVVDGNGVAHAKTTFNPNMITRHRVPEIDQLVKEQPGLIKEQTERAIQQALRYLATKRPEFKITPYIHLGYGSMVKILAVVSDAYLNRFYVQGLRPSMSNNKQPLRSLADIETKVVSLNVIRGAVDALGFSFNDVMSAMKKANYRWTIPRNMIAELSKGRGPKSKDTIVSQSLTYDDKNGTVFTEYQFRDSATSAIRQEEATFIIKSTRQFPAGTAWQTFYEMNDETRARYMATVSAMLDVADAHVPAPATKPSAPTQPKPTGPAYGVRNSTH